MGQLQHPILKSHGSMTWNTKYYVSFILTIFCVVMVSDKFISRRLLVVFPIMLAAAFFLSLAIVEVNDGVLRYRRFRKWKTIDKKNVLACGELWPGVIGYVRLSSYVFPWKQLYFVLDARPGQNPFARGDSQLLEYIKKLPTNCEPQDPLKFEAPAALSNLALLAVGFAAAIFYSLMRVLLPPLTTSWVPEPSTNANQPSLIVFNAQRAIFSLLHSFPLTLSVCAILVTVTTVRRRDRDAWSYALVAGVLSAAILFHFL